MRKEGLLLRENRALARVRKSFINTLESGEASTPAVCDMLKGLACIYSILRTQDKVKKVFNLDWDGEDEAD
jgi:hypothetical protein